MTGARAIASDSRIHSWDQYFPTTVPKLGHKVSSWRLFERFIGRKTTWLASHIVDFMAGEPRVVRGGDARSSSGYDGFRQ